MEVDGRFAMCQKYKLESTPGVHASVEVAEDSYIVISPKTAEDSYIVISPKTADYSYIVISPKNCSFILSLIIR